MTKKKTPLKSLIFGTATTESQAFNVGILIMRAIFGLSMALGHGLGKMPPPQRMVEGLMGMGFPMPGFFAWCAGLSEFLGGLLIAVGFLTRPSATFLAITMGVAAFIAHAADPFQKKELALLYFGFAVAMVFVGSGRYAIDDLFRKKK